MTEITYKDGIVVISQYGITAIRFRPCNLDYASRMELAAAVVDMQGPKEAGDPGFLKTQPVEARQKALEEALGVSFPCGTGE